MLSIVGSQSECSRSGRTESESESESGNESKSIRSGRSQNYKTCTVFDNSRD